MLAYSGAELEYFISEQKKFAMSRSGLDTLYERDFVDSIRKYCFKGNMQKVFVVCGLRATGKTFGLLQAVDDFSDTIYIQAQKDEEQTGRSYIEFLRNITQRNIIIDEYSWIKDNRDLSYYLWTLVENGKRVVITGTHSIALDYLENGELIHRTYRVNVNLFTYQEFCRIYKKNYTKASCDEFLKTGGIFKDYAIDSFTSMTRYIQEAVIDDLTKFMNLSDAEAKAIVYDIMYLAVCDSDVEEIKYPGSRREDAEYRDMLELFGIDPTVKVTPLKLDVASQILEKAEFVVKTYNIVDFKETRRKEDCRYRLHLVNPSLTYQMVSNVFNKKSADERLGKAFEAYLVSWMSLIKNNTDHLWYADMGQLGGEPELELVIINPDEHLAYLFDAKLREAASLSNNSSLVSEKLEKSLCDGVDIGGRFIVCNTKEEKCGERNGRNVIFTRLDCDTLSNYRQFDESFERLSEDVYDTNVFNQNISDDNK